MTVQELISELSKYPRDMEVNEVNSVFENIGGTLTLTHKNTPEEVESFNRRNDEWDRQHQERMDRRGEATSFASKW